MRRINRITTVLAVLAVAVTATPQAGAAAPGTGALPSTTRAAAWAVTLITGDRVDLTERADGRITTSIQRAAGREHVTFLTSGRGDDLTVLPSDAVWPVSAGTV